MKDVQFEELMILDPEALQQLSPVYGVIFLFKWPSGTTYARETPLDGIYDRSHNIFFAEQLIQNACGTQALLSILFNKDVTTVTDQGIDVGSKLRQFKDFAFDLPSDLRGEALSNSDLIRETHNSFARSSPFVDETTRQTDGDDDVYHFIAYTSVNGILYELDGLQPAPISHGPCAADTATFAEKLMPVLQRRIQRYPATEIRFNLLAMCRDLRLRARDIGDEDGIERQEANRRNWLYENALRRHNFVGFIGQVLEEVVRSKTQSGNDEDYHKWIEDAKIATLKRMDNRRSRKSANKADEMEIDQL